MGSRTERNLINRVIYQDFLTTDTGNSFIALQLLNQDQSIAIHGISWGYFMVEADRDNFNSGQLVVYQNFMVNPLNQGQFARSSPLVEEAATMVYTSQVTRASGPWGREVFDRPLVIPANEIAAVVMVVPFLDAAQANTIQSSLTVMAEYDKGLRGAYSPSVQIDFR